MSGLLVKVNTRWDTTDPLLSLVPIGGNFKPVLASGGSAIYTSDLQRFQATNRDRTGKTTTVWAFVLALCYTHFDGL